MWQKGSFASLAFKDIEQGIQEQNENLVPLLPPNTGPRPIRPRNPKLAPTPNLQRLQIEPESAISTPDNTPAPDTGFDYSKKWRRSDRRLRRLNTELLEAIEKHDVEEVERLLKAGANANATCRLDMVSACHMAAITGGDALGLLVKHGAEKNRQDRLGRSPLHLAAYAGNAKPMAILLDFPEDMQRRVENDDMSSEAEEDVRKRSKLTKTIVNVMCDLGEVNFKLPKTWKDNIDHDCKEIKGSLPLLQPGWTPLHVAASCARRHCTRLLLAAGADPNIRDLLGRTPLDVAGSAYYHDKEVNNKNFAEVVKMLLQSGSQSYSMKAGGLNIDTPLHTATELSNTECINILLDAGVSVTCLNSAGETPLHLCVKKELEEPLQLLSNYSYKDVDPMQAVVDVKDKDGHTVLQAAVEAAWMPGVCIALESGADVTIKANDGETPIHSAATLGNLDVLHEILSLAKQKDFIDYQNEEGETPLIKAIIHGHLSCVELLLEEGASINIKMPGEVNILHVACDNGHIDILKLLLEYNDGTATEMLNSLTSPDRRGFGPIHFAVLNNNVECVQYLISKNADIRLRTTTTPHKCSTPLHLAAKKNYVDIAKIILASDRTTLHEVNSLGWYPLHTAGHHGSRDIITLLLQEGADLSGYTDGPKKHRRTAIDMIINNMSKPTEYFEEIFDSYICSNSQNFLDSKCEVSVDYRILMPNVCEMEQMKVTQALLKTGNRHGQRRLLVHPLVESFLYHKWKALLPFFYAIIVVYALFVSSLTIFIIAVFFYKDTETTPPAPFNPNIWSYMIYSTILLIIVEEVFYMNVKSIRYFLQLETWIKFASIVLAAILPPSVTFLASLHEWPRHVATCALLLSWIELMFLLSRFPNWGYYVLMFGKVAANVVKILLTFAFLVIGFSLSFMIQFHSEIPFDGPWAAFVKTMVMMTSEFDYVALFDEEHTKELATSLIVVRIIFVVFLILAAIVLMNLLVGVAVNDINDLEILGNIRRLAKHVEFLGTLDNLVFNKFFNIALPKRLSNRIKSRRKVISVMTFCPGQPSWRFHKTLPSRIRNALLDKAQEQKKQMEMESNMESFKKIINEMHETITAKKDKPEVKSEAMPKVKYEEIIKRLNSLDDGVEEVKGQVEVYVEDTKCPLEKLNVKMDQMSLEIEAIKHFLTRLESKLGNL